ncbi:MAG: hypothetical protein AAF688_02975 [Bacteroidota bacterium]
MIFISARKSYFEETQKFTQWWLWLIIIALVLIPVIGIYQQIMLGKPFGDKPMSDKGLIVFLLAMIGFGIFFWSLKLETKITSTGISMRYFPLTKKQIGWEEIQSLTIVKYGFVGYGIRFGSKYGTVYNTKGNLGLWVQLKNGKKFVIGTQKEAELSRLLKSENILNLLNQFTNS